MSENGCNGNCEDCKSKGHCEIEKDPLNASSKIGRVIGIVSGKGGVGKSTVTSLLARKLAKEGYKVGIMDADITGPSIPRMFGLGGEIYGTDAGMEPMVSREGIKVVSMNFFLETEESTVILRGPVLAGIIKQFWTEVHWGELDYLLIDMPPGTGDIPLTIYQSIPVDGIVIVTSPQDLVRMIVMKAYNMAKEMKIPVLGLVENYSYFTCPDCGKEYKIFGESGIDELSRELGIKVLAKLPIIPAIAGAADRGQAADVGIDVDIDALTGK
ncbi:MAG: P-loop NTPase [Butyrivibrio sp.]